MLLSTQKWLQLADGRKYLGNVSASSGQPEGLGLLDLGNDTYYAGNISWGSQSGRGFLISHRKWETVEEVWQPAPYEQIMETADFDQCGRVIHVERVGSYVKHTRNHEEWRMVKDGMWDGDSLMRPVDVSALSREPWSKAVLSYVNGDVYDGSLTYARHYTSCIGNRKSDGELSINRLAFVSLFDAMHLLVCSSYGNVFVIAPGEEVVFSSRSTSTVTVTYRYALSMGRQAFGQLITLALAQWKELPPLPVETLYRQALASELYALEVENKPLPDAYAAAIAQAVPSAVVEFADSKAARIRLADDIWTIWQTPDNVWLNSERAMERLSVFGRKPEEVAAVAAMTSDILHTAETSLKAWKKENWKKLQKNNCKKY